MSVHDVCMYVSGDVVLYFLNTADIIINKFKILYKEKKKEKQTQEKRYEKTPDIHCKCGVYMCKKYKNTHVYIYILYIYIYFLIYS